MRIFTATAALAALAACAPSVPDSAAGVGFGSYESYEQQRLDRDAALAAGQGFGGAGTPMTPTVSSEPLRDTEAPGDGSTGQSAPVQPSTGEPAAVADSVDTSVITSEELSAAGLPTAESAQAPEAGGAESEALVDTNNPGLSDEQSFDAVAARETIASDRARLEQAAELYEVVPPTALPERPEDSMPNIVAYALSTTNSVGEPLYQRSGSVNRALRNCAGYASPDLAQMDFLDSGGPERDRKNLDPDGDGFACGWDPAPFRLAAGR